MDELLVRGPSDRNAKREAVETWPRTRRPDGLHNNRPEGLLKMVKSLRQAVISKTVMSETAKARRREVLLRGNCRSSLGGLDFKRHTRLGA